LFGWAAKWNRHRPNRLRRLAETVDALADKDQQLIAETQRVEGLRGQAAVELHSICARFAGDLNGLLKHSKIELDPPEFDASLFKDDAPNLFQINISGRILQIEFESPHQLYSTEHFRQPYILQGSVRAFNQELLEHDVIEEQLLFFCVQKKNHWRFFDARTYRSGPLDEDYLISLMERLV
jgi:hypothetical protein